jgi:N6-adenosine-specific RNA methylase IME4
MLINRVPTVLYIDPPWFYNERSQPDTKFCLGVHGHYPVMTDQELIDFKPCIDHVASSNTVMFLWGTGARNDFAAELIKAWDFNYSTVAFIWNKLNPKALTPTRCPGYFTSSSCEFLHVGTRVQDGNVHKPVRKMIPQLWSFPRREHSRKPDQFREIIEVMYPYHLWIEMFARSTAPGWQVYGNEVEKFNVRSE